MGMVRKQFFIDVEQNRRLKALAAALGKSEGELIRDGLQAILAAAEADSESWRRGLRRLSGAWAERDDMQEFVRGLRTESEERLKRVGLRADRA